MYEIDDIFTTEMKNRNDEKYKNLKKDINIKGNGLCFILGAGVSQSMGLPNWQTLLAEGIGELLYNFNGIDKSENDEGLREIHENALKKDNKKFVEGAKGKYNFTLNGSNLLEIAEYILSYCNSFSTSNNPKIRDGIAEGYLVSLIHECLYHNTEELREIFTEEKYKGSTLEAVTDVIERDFRKKKIFAKKNYRQIRKGYGISKCEKNQVVVITYNYDNLLELSLEKKKRIPKREIKTISYNSYHSSKKEDLKSIMKIEENKINICHIHGYIDITNYESTCSGLVLSESSYHNVEDHQYDWINTYQANAMQTNTCVLVGFSGEDSNFRRIIRKNKEGESYIFFTVDDIVKRIFSKEIEKEKKDENDKESEIIENLIKKKDNYLYERLLLLFMIQAKTKYWENLGIHPIWTTLDELPEKIKKLLKK